MISTGTIARQRLPEWLAEAFFSVDKLNVTEVLSRSTLLNYVSHGIALLEPIYRAQWQSVLDSAVIAMDEVPMKAGRKGPGQMKQSYFWPIFGDRDEVVFTWSASRSRQHPEQQLRGFIGTLLTDGYDVYSRVVSQLNTDEARITHANCWAHSRRAFERALDMEPTLAQHALALIARLYQAEKVIRERELPPDEITAWRIKHSVPIIDEFFIWVAQQRQRPELLPSNPLTKALVYVHEREASLRVFLNNPGVAIDTNYLERALRVIPMGRNYPHPTIMQGLLGYTLCPVRWCTSGGLHNFKGFPGTRGPHRLGGSACAWSRVE